MSAVIPDISRTFAKRVKVDPQSGCWIWAGSLDSYGYGSVRLGTGGRTRKTHQVVWIHFHGPVPSGLELDHLCSIRACCNPAHLEPVTHAENLRRAAARRTSCPQGHPWDETNTYRNRHGWRKCRKCNAAHAVIARQRQREAS